MQSVAFYEKFKENEGFTVKAMDTEKGDLSGNTIKLTFAWNELIDKDVLLEAPWRSERDRSEPSTPAPSGRTVAEKDKSRAIDDNRESTINRGAGSQA